MQSLSRNFNVRFQWKCQSVFSHYGKAIVQIVGSRQNSEAPISEKCFSTFQNMGLEYVTNTGKELQQSCVVFLVILTVFGCIRLMFLKTAFVPESLRTHADFFWSLLSKCHFSTVIHILFLLVKQ